MPSILIYADNQETQQVPTEEVSLEVLLSNGQKVLVSVLTSDQTEDVLEVRCLFWTALHPRVQGWGKIGTSQYDEMHFLSYPQAVAAKLDLPDDLIGYFSLFLVREKEDGAFSCKFLHTRLLLCASGSEFASLSPPRMWHFLRASLLIFLPLSLMTFSFCFFNPQLYGNCKSSNYLMCL